MILNPVDWIDPAATAGAAESLEQKVQPPLSKMQSRKVNNATAVWRVIFPHCECDLVTTGYCDCKHLHVVQVLIYWTSGSFVEHTERSKRALHKRGAGCHRHRYLVHAEMSRFGRPLSIWVPCFRFLIVTSVMNRLGSKCELRSTSAGPPATTGGISFLTKGGEAETCK